MHETNLIRGWDKTRHWKLKFIILLLICLPGFTDYFVRKFSGPIMPGLTHWDIIYFFLVFVTVLIVSGRTILIFSISAVALISVSVVFTGGLIAFLRILKGFSVEKIYEYSPHYVSLLVRLFSVVPIAIAVVATIPVREYECVLLKRMTGVSTFERIILMVSRVLSHVIYTVLPTIVQIMKEERYARKAYPVKEMLEDSVMKSTKFRRRVSRVIAEILTIGVSFICCSLEYIPLWAQEISRLPSRKEFKENANGTPY